MVRNGLWLSAARISAVYDTSKTSREIELQVYFGAKIKFMWFFFLLRIWWAFWRPLIGMDFRIICTKTPLSFNFTFHELFEEHWYIIYCLFFSYYKRLQVHMTKFFPILGDGDFFILFFFLLSKFFKTHKPVKVLFLPPMAQRFPQTLIARTGRFWKSGHLKRQAVHISLELKREEAELQCSTSFACQEPHLQSQCFLIWYFPSIPQQLKEKTSKWKYRTKNVWDLSSI